MTDAVPARRYVVDATHTSVTWRIKHLGLAWYTGRFARMAGTLDFNPDLPERMRLDAAVELRSVRTDYEGPAGDWDSNLATREDLLDAARYPTARFVSTAVRRTGASTASFPSVAMPGH